MRKPKQPYSYTEYRILGKTGTLPRPDETRQRMRKRKRIGFRSFSMFLPCISIRYGTIDGPQAAALRAMTNRLDTHGSVDSMRDDMGPPSIDEGLKLAHEALGAQLMDDADELHSACPCAAREEIVRLH
jgi:hypothetical protein